MVKNFDQILDYAIEKGASDIHLSPNKPAYLRISGKILTVGEIIQAVDIQNFCAEMLATQQNAKLEEFRDIDFVYTTIRKNRFRGNAYHTRDGLAMAFRQIPEKIPDFAFTGLPRFVLQYMMSLNKGLVLVVGPTGHGKSTTLASMIKHRADNANEHFVLMEDPIEFLIDSDRSIVHQRSLGRDVQGFERGLKAALREDPDVMMVGEMRDLETISAALTAAETGHVVFSTLHTNSAAETIHRIIDAFPAEKQGQIRSQLAATLAMVVSQRLIPAREGGRALAYEILTSNYAIANHIRQNSIFQIPNAMQTDGTGRMVLFDQSLAELVINDRVDYKVAAQNANSVEQLDYILETSGYQVVK